MQKRKPSKKVSIVTVTHNSESVIEKCLQSIPDNINVYVVDNASSDNACKIAEKFTPQAKLITCEKNLGFGRANNLALEKITTEFALLLNPDTVLQDDSIDKLIATAERYPEAAIIAPTLYHEDGSLQQSYKNSVFEREKLRTKYIEPSGDICAQCLSGAAMLLRMSCFKKSGFFDPNIFLFYEDDDICLTARNNGYSLVLTPDARIMHLMGKSSPPTTEYIRIKNWHMMWSRLYIEKKYNCAHESRIMAVKNLYISAFKAASYSLMLNREKTTKYLARTSAAVCFLLGKKAIL